MDNESRVQLRRFPYPYRAMLAICSDLDETPDWQTYWEIMRFLNTTETTSMGSGVGLEVGNSIYFDMPLGQFAYWNTDDAGRAMVRALIHSGHIDCLHSYGDLAMKREHAGKALDELARYDCRLKVWVDHGTAATNFGADIMQGHGDEPEHEAYHADLTCGYGIRYVWRGRVTSVIGQDAPRSLHDLFNARHPVASLRTVAKEWAKGVRSRRGDVKYAMHGPNRLIRPTHLRDGQPVCEFIRCNPHWGGVSYGDRPDGLPQVLTKRFLDNLIERQGCCILYTHLGKVTNRKIPFVPETVAIFDLLARYQREQRILVTTTCRLLDYCQLTREIHSKIRNNGNTIELYIPSKLPMDGLTLSVNQAKITHILLNGQEETKGFQSTSMDQVKQTRLSWPWRPLEFPELLGL